MLAASTKSRTIDIWYFEFVRQKSSWLICLLATQDRLQIMCEPNWRQLSKLCKIALC